MGQMGKEKVQNTDYDALFKASPEDRVLWWMQLTKNEQGHYLMGDGDQGDTNERQDWMSTIMPHVALVSVNVDSAHPSTTFSYVVQPNHCNRLLNLHGGASATLFDYLTTMAIAAVNRPDFWKYMGVSRTLNVTYFRPVPAGTEVLVETEIVQIGRKLATLRGVMKRRSDGAIMALCEHGKVNIDSDVDSKL